MNDQDSEDDSADEGFSLLLRGLLPSTLKDTTGWDDVNDSDSRSTDISAESASASVERTNNIQINPASLPGLGEPKMHSHIPEGPCNAPPPLSSAVTCDGPIHVRHVFDRSFHSINSSSGCRVAPPVHVVHTGSDRGSVLVASRAILKGTVIYTEEALLAAQIPPSVHIEAEPECKSIVADSSHDITPQHLYRVRGCQQCFRSMEPASSFSCSANASDWVISEKHELPLAYMWPIPEFGESLGPVGTTRAVSSDDPRQICLSCSSTFCCRTCYDDHSKDVGSCCLNRRALQAVCKSSSSRGQTTVNPALLLATRLFCCALFEDGQLHRDRIGGRGMKTRALRDLCGEARDINELEFGEEEIGHDGQQRMHSLRQCYVDVCNSLNVTDADRETLSLDFFHRLVAIAARNAFRITTQSPFTSYYAGLIRATGRGSARHGAAMEGIARILGSSDGTLSRAMDRMIEERCAVPTVALFTLTAKINHSCDPNAEVCDQVFSDCVIDVRAIRDIAAGEEVTISYINLGRDAGRVASDKRLRRRTLQSRYLFLCNCARCLAK